MFAEHRAKVLAQLKDGGVVFLQAPEEQSRHDTDMDLLFRQESNFFYMTGVHTPGAAMVADCATQKWWLFVPRLPVEYSVWMHVESLDEIRAKADGVTDVKYLDELPAFWAELKPSIVHVRKADVKVPGAEKLTVEPKHLQLALNEARVYKTDKEIEAIKKACKICSEAHTAAMKFVRPGLNERDMDALFLYKTYQQGCRFQAFNPISAGSPRSATLHYTANDQPLKDGDMLLLDAGCELNCYAADITRTYPVNGKYSEDQRLIYSMVLKANKAVIAAVKEGTDWTDMHRLSERILTEEMIKAGFFKGTVEECLKNHVVNLFYMHGLGHLMGLDVHDVGGYPPGLERIQEPGINRLRTRRICKEGMVLTVEPGLYFVRAVLEPALADPKYDALLNKDRVRAFLGFGGVRIEDDIVIRKNGCEVLTSAPKEIEDVEAVMAAH